jgi:hypothetical protein
MTYTTIYKPRCANRCDSGFHLQNVVLDQPGVRVPIYMCKRCGYWTLSTQTRFINSCYAPGSIIKSPSDYEVALEYYLRDGISYMF